MSPRLILEAANGNLSAMEKCELIILENAKMRNDEQRPSMGQDIKKNRRTEIDYISGLIVRKAKDAGIEVPYNKGIQNLVKKIESGEIAAGIKEIVGLFN